MPITPEQFQALYPKIIGWIDLRLALHAGQAKPVSAAGFKRLQEYFGRDTLNTARFVVLDKLPVPPLASLGLTSPEFAEFERMEPAGITYRQTFFVRSDQAASESLFFHELIHVIQWSLLGPETFVKQYAAGLAASGYRNSPLEDMAYSAQTRFVQGDVFDAGRYVKDYLR